MTFVGLTFGGQDELLVELLVLLPTHMQQAGSKTLPRHINTSSLR